MIILGIDPGSRKAGYALIRMNGKKFEYIDSGTLKFNTQIDFLDRVPEFYNSVKDIISKHSPDVIAIESLIYKKSPTALIKLAQARGAMLAAMQETHQGKIYEYSPNLIKSTTSGYGHAKKENIQLMLNRLIGARDYETDDESDALAAAICHAMHNGNNLLNSTKTKIPKRRSQGIAKSVAHKIKQRGL